MPDLPGFLAHFDVRVVVGALAVAYCVQCAKVKAMTAPGGTRNAPEPPDTLSVGLLATGWVGNRPDLPI